MPTPCSSEFVEWREKAQSILERIFGEQHRFPRQFALLSYLPRSSLARAGEGAFSRGIRQAEGILRAALFELDSLGADRFESGSVDPELWDEVRTAVAEGRWAQVASQTAIFLENHVRVWAGRPEEEMGIPLVNAVFHHENGEFPLGKTVQEREGWHVLAMGFWKAVRNVNTHRIQNRPDLERYAMGVLGTASLLITELRYQHGAEFRSSSAFPEEGRGADAHEVRPQ